MRNAHAPAHAHARARTVHHRLLDVLAATAPSPIGLGCGDPAGEIVTALEAMRGSKTLPRYPDPTVSDNGI